MASYLSAEWGLAAGFALDAAILYLYLWSYGLNPKITSGFRSPDKQRELLARWEAGDPSVVVKPATNSKHSVTYKGAPAAEAIDISTTNHKFAAEIAKFVDVGAGYYYRKSDPVHFYKSQLSGGKNDV